MLTERTVATDHRRERTSERRGACGCCERGGASNTRGAGPLSECGLSGQSRRKTAASERARRTWVRPRFKNADEWIVATNQRRERTVSGDKWRGEGPLQNAD